MKCPKCGVENAAGSRFCEACGAELPVQPAPEPESKPSEAAEAPKNPVDQVKQLVTKNKKLLLAVGAGLIVLIILISVIASVATSGNGFVERKTVLWGAADVNSKEIAILSGTKLLSDKIELDYDSDDEIGFVGYEPDYDDLCGELPSTSLTGDVGAMVGTENTLYVVKGKNLLTVEEGVVKYALSADGKGIAYITEEEDDDDYYNVKRTLWLYNISKQKSVNIADDVNQFAISPDGKSVAYTSYKVDEETYKTTYTLYYYNGTDSTKLASGEEIAVLGVSNGGKYIYAWKRSDDGDKILYSYDKKGEESKKIGTVSNSTVYFNTDLTQILYYNDGKTYVSAKAGEPNKISSQEVRMLFPSNTVGGVSTGGYGAICTVSTFYDHVYAADGGAWYIRKNADKTAKLVSKAYDMRLDESGEYLYYLNSDDELYVLQVSKGSSAKDKAYKLAEDVDRYIVTPDRKLVYYISDHSLYSVNGKKGGKSRQVYNDDVDNKLRMNAKGVVYFISDDALYACSNGKKAQKVMDEVKALDSIDGIVFARDDGGSLYVTDGSKKLKKVMD